MIIKTGDLDSRARNDGKNVIKAKILDMSNIVSLCLHARKLQGGLSRLLNKFPKIVKIKIKVIKANQ